MKIIVDDLLGCGALKQLPQAGEGEIKSMHTAKAARGRGIAAQLLSHLEAHAKRRIHPFSHLGHLAGRRLHPARRPISDRDAQILRPQPLDARVD